MFNVTLSNNARSGPGQSRVPPVPPVPPSPSPPPPPSRTRQTRAEGRGRAVHAHARVCRLNLSASIHSRPFICCGIRCRTGRQDFPSRGGGGGRGKPPLSARGNSTKFRRNFQRPEIHRGGGGGGEFDDPLRRAGYFRSEERSRIGVPTESRGKLSRYRVRNFTPISEADFFIKELN